MQPGKSPNQFRSDIQEVFDEFTWLESVKKDDEINRFQGNDLVKGIKVERCLICTLPLGSCQHSEEWKDQMLAARLNNGLDSDIDSAFDVLGGTGNSLKDRGNTPLFIDVDEDVDLEHLCWEVFDDRPVDRIGNSKVHLFTPFGRFWHTTTYIGKYLITFGGIQIRKEKLYKDIREVEDANDLTFLNDVRVYNIEKQSWHGVRVEGKHNESTDPDRNKIEPAPLKFPAPRYGHCAAALDENNLLIFGGRGPGNIIYGDTWLYNLQEDRWYEVPSTTFFGDKIMPSPRFHASMTAITKQHEIYLFGGTNEEENYGDFWIFRQKTMLWEKIIPIGVPPSPRYGHVLLSIEKQQTLLVVGGCCVSPVAEWEASQLPEEASIAQMHRKYQSLLDQQFIQLHKKLRGLSSTDYRIAEEKLFQTWQGAKAMSYYLKKTTKHTNPHLDLFFYQIADEMWIDRKFPRFMGEIPKSRMYFGAQAIGHYLFVIGGCYPTALFTKCVDHNPHSNLQNVDINVLDLRTHTWTKPLPINSDKYYQQTMLIAQADVIRAQKKLQAERLEGFTLGAPGGLTKEVAIAQAMLNVCLWRKQQLEKKVKEDFLSPNPIVGASLTALRQRLVLVGGFTPSIGYRQDVLALSVEHLYERERRLEEVYHAKLELDRKEEEAKMNMENLLSAYELRAKLMEEQRNRDRELQEMAVQDYLSSLPPLSIPNPVKLVKANHNTIWVSWDRMVEDSSGNAVEPSELIYFLYIKSSIEILRENEEVLVVENPHPKALLSSSPKKALRPYSRGERYSGPKEGYYFTEFCRRHPGIIRKIKGKGLFDILYDDGSYEINVPRYRIKINSHLSTVGTASIAARFPLLNLPPQINTNGTSQNSTRDSFSTKDSNNNGNPSPKKVTSPKKLRLLQRMASLKSNGASHKLRSLHACGKKPRPLQGKLLLQYPTILSQWQHHYPGTTHNSTLSYPSTARTSYPPSALHTHRSTAPDFDNHHPMKQPLAVQYPFFINESDENDTLSVEASIHSNTSFHFPQQSQPIHDHNIANEIKAMTEQPTVTVDSEWRLVYVGNDTHYACTHIIPQNIYESEPGIQAGVMFSVQVQGVDFPRYERSRLSKPMIYYTINPTVEENRLNESLQTTSSPTDKIIPFQRTVSASTINTDMSTQDSAQITTMASKTKKQTITTTVKHKNGQRMISIEKRGYYTYGEGIGNHYD